MFYRPILMCIANVQECNNIRAQISSDPISHPQQRQSVQVRRDSWGVNCIMEKGQAEIRLVKMIVELLGILELWLYQQCMNLLKYIQGDLHSVIDKNACIGDVPAS